MKFNYELIYDFDNLYRAYLASRRSKRSTREVIQFEMNVGPNLCQLQQELRDGNYRLSGYYHFTIHDPKVREIYALHYRDRILQHSLCDNVLAPYFETHLIYDNAACRKDKGTLFAMNRLNGFLHEHFRDYGTKGCFLKCDVRKFFDNIDHEILKRRLAEIVDDKRTLRLLFHIIDSYEVTPGKGIPMGNLHLEFNEKTQIFPINHGVEYLGWRFGLTETGAVTRRLKKHSKIRWKHRLRKLQAEYAVGRVDLKKVKESIQNFGNHMSYGNTWKMYNGVMRKFVLK